MTPAEPSTGARDRRSDAPAGVPLARLRPDRLVCAECDLLHALPAPDRPRAPTPGAAGHPRPGHYACSRCGAPLDLSRAASFDPALACALAGLVALLVAHLNPVLSIQIQGQVRSATLWEAAAALVADGAWLVAALALLTTLVAPVLEMGAVVYVLVPLRRGRLAPGSEPILRLMQAVRPWVMVEVFMLGVLVSLVKLAALSTVVPGIGMWAFGAVMLLSTAMASAFDNAHVWAATAALRRAAPAPRTEATSAP